MNKAIFLDRDGVLIEEKGYIRHLSESALFPFAAQAVRLMNEAGFLVFVITNQSAVARGIATHNDVEQIHADIRQQLLEQDHRARIHRFYYCPFFPSHPWRKPEPGMLLQAARDFDVDLKESIMMGDSAIDIHAGKNAGCKTVLVLTGKGKRTRTELRLAKQRVDFVFENILTAARGLF